MHQVQEIDRTTNQGANKVGTSKFKSKQSCCKWRELREQFVRQIAEFPQFVRVDSKLVKKTTAQSGLIDEKQRPVESSPRGWQISSSFHFIRESFKTASISQPATSQQEGGAQSSFKFTEPRAFSFKLYSTLLKSTRLVVLRCIGTSCVFSTNCNSNN